MKNNSVTPLSMGLSEHKPSIGERFIRLGQTKGLHLFLGTLAVVLLLYWIPPSILFNPHALTEFLVMDDRCRACWFVLAQVVATVLGLPGTVLVIAGGAIFGLIWGTIWSTIGATLGAIVAFWIARYWLRDWVERILGHHPMMQRFNHITHHHSLRCVLTIRFMPISPFNVMNFLLGLTPIQLKPYAIGTFLGIIPGTLVYTGLGVSGRKALAGEGVFALIAMLAVLAILSVLPILVKKS